MRVLHQTTDGLDKTEAGQWYRLLRTARFGGDVGEPDAVIRVDIAVEHTGDRQSRYKAEVWTPQGWAEIVRVFPGDDAWFMDLTNSYSRDAAGKEASLDAVAAELFERALAVLA